MNDVIQHGFEVVEENGIRGALEDQSEAPVWVDATARSKARGRNSSICKEESYGEELKSRQCFA